MALKIFGFTLISNADLAELKAAASREIDTIVPFWKAEADKVVAALKNTEIGDAVADSIVAISDANLSGAEKFSKVVGEIAPLVLNYVNRGGVNAVIEDVEDLARQLVQSTYNDVMSTGFGKIVRALRDLLGL